MKIHDCLERKDDAVIKDVEGCDGKDDDGGGLAPQLLAGDQHHEGGDVHYGAHNTYGGIGIPSYFTGGATRHNDIV